MRSRFLVFVLIFSLGCAFLGFVLSNFETNNSTTLAYLVSRDSWNAEPNETVKKLAQWVGDGGSWLVDLEANMIIYAVLVACGILLAIKAVVSAMRIGREERSPPRDHAAYITVNEAAGSPLAQEVKQLRAPHPGSPAESATHLPTSSLSPARRSDAARLRPSGWSRLAPYGHGLTGKMIFTFTAIIATFGSLTLVLIYFTLTSSLTKQWIQRARITAVNVADSAPPYLFKNDAAGLREFLRSHASRAGMAYVLVEDRKGEIFSHSFAARPQEVQNAAPSDGLRSESQRLFRLEDGMVYEVSAPVLEGRMGAVRVGLWKDEVDVEISKTVIPIIKLVGLVVCTGILMAIFLVWTITLPILRLVRTARRISEGELDVPAPGVNDTGEFGELSRSFERLRSSVKAAMTRLHE
jgi:HAMP domain-containing protein